MRKSSSLRFQHLIKQSSSARGMAYTENFTDYVLSNNTNDTLDSDVPPERNTFRTAFFGIIITLQVSVMVGMGAVTTIQEIWRHVKAPYGIVIALGSQFVLLPLCAFGLLYVLQISALHSLSVLIVSCCPGGSISNLYTYLCDGDVSLSVVLTTVSTTLAIGMTPLNLWIYSRHWQMTNIHVPYSKIAITLAWILAPLAVGMVIKVWRPKIASVLAKVSSTIGMILTWVALLFQYLDDPDAYSQYWQLWFLSLALPTGGFLIGYLASFLFRRSHRVCRTIAMETGIQSISLSSSIIMISFPSELHIQLLPFSFMYGISFSCAGMLLAAGIRIHKCVTEPKKEVTVKAETETFI